VKIEAYGKRFSSPLLKDALKIHSDIRKFMADFLREEGFIEIPPVIISGVTDPLNHPTSKSQVEVNGFNYELTKSMIFHKQIILQSLDKIFSFSPNVRLEPVERKETGRHLIEFTQLDVEVYLIGGREILSFLRNHLKKLRVKKRIRSMVSILNLNFLKL